LQQYKYIIIGAGISGCSVAFELQKYSSDILLIDKLCDVGQGASGAAGAFLSPLLGKPNKFKQLVTDSLKYSTKFYKQNTPNDINNCGTIRVPKDDRDKIKFKSYIPYIDFDFEQKDDGYFFKIGSIVNSYNICKTLSQNVKKLFNYEVKKIEFKNNLWIIDDKIKSKNLILTTGASVNLISQSYFNIRPVWGQRIVIKTSTFVPYNYHKECSISQSILQDDGTYITSIGATHHKNILEKEISQIDTNELLDKANKIIPLENVKVLKEVAGARSCSVDYLPIVGKLIDEEQTLKEFPHLKNGTYVQEERFNRYDNLFVLNGIGGRGFVLAPFLASKLVDFIVNKKDIDTNLKVDRLFKRWVRKL
jgi:glycine/D-amino acid oxidase-like deaminating enzyme